MTLYEIDSTIMDCVDEETGEIIDLEVPLWTTLWRL